jgi:hypothetical protein
MDRRFVVDGLKVSKVVDIPSPQWLSTLNQRKKSGMDSTGIKSLSSKVLGRLDRLSPPQCLESVFISPTWKRDCNCAMRRFESRCEAVMWKITTRGFTLQEVLILAAMNIATAGIAVEKRGQGGSQNSTKKGAYISSVLTGVDAEFLHA